MMIAKGWGVNVLLTVLVLVGGGGLWLADTIDEQHKAEDKAQRLLCTLKPEQLKSLQFRGKDGQQVSLERQEGQWRIVKPQLWRTDGQAVQRLLEIVTRHYERVVVERPDQKALQPFGLDTPQAILTLEPEAPLPAWQIRIGETVPASDSRYAQLGEQGAVVTLAKADSANLIQASQDLRDSHLTTTRQGEAVQQLALQRDAAKGSLELTKEESTQQWRLLQPWADGADSSRVRRWLDTLLAYSGHHFKPLPEPISQRPPNWTLTIKAADRAADRVTIWRYEGELLAQRQGEPDALVLDNYLLEELDRQALDLVALRPLGEDVDVDGLTLLYQGRQFNADKVGEAKSMRWPVAAWDTIEEALTRPAQEALLPVTTTEPPSIMVTVGSGSERVFPFWRWQEGRYRIAPPGRPVHLGLSRAQSASLDDALKALTVENKETVTAPPAAVDKK
ncbi:MAG: DUF4340 domain-containing protein [Magnetococcales bacterium]|nr:DUF4340 domain-containing protein [Magnetococcales bacterium]